MSKKKLYIQCIIGQNHQRIIHHISVQSITYNCWIEIKVEGKDLVYSKWGMCLFSSDNCAPVVAECHTRQYPWLCGHNRSAVYVWRLRFRIVKKYFSFL